METFLIFALLAVLLVLRVPIAAAAALTSMLYMLTGVAMPLSFAPLTAFQALDSFSLLAVPFFILAGQIMATGGIARQILNLADEILGALPGGHALTTVLASMFFADLSGSGPGTVAAIGTIMIPAMEQHHYRKDFAAALAASAGCLAVIIPPSNPMVVFGIVSDTSIGRLFLAGFIPGFLVALSLLIPAYLISRRNGWAGSRRRGSLRSIGRAAWQAKWALLVPVIILGGIYGGIFTPTESAAVACLYAILVGLFIYREFTWRELPRVLRAGALTIVPIMFIISMAVLFGQVITLMDIPAGMAAALGGLTGSPLLLMLCINLFLLFVGMFMDTIAAIVLLAPILMPLAVKIGIDPVQFGVIMVVNLAIGFMTPPLGVNLFVAGSISGMPGEKVARAGIPMVLSMLVALALVILIPQLSLFLPTLYYGK